MITILLLLIEILVQAITIAIAFSMVFPILGITSSNFLDNIKITLLTVIPITFINRIYSLGLENTTLEENTVFTTIASILGIAILIYPFWVIKKIYYDESLFFLILGYIVGIIGGSILYSAVVLQIGLVFFSFFNR